MTEAEVQDRLNSDRNLIIKLGKGHGLGGNNGNHVNAGRKEGTKDITPFMREVISASASLDTAKNTARAFGVSEATAHNYKNGYVTRANGKDKELVKKKEVILDEIRERASDLVMQTLGLITPTKLGEVEKAVDLTRIAKDLSHVIEKATPEKNNIGNQTNIVIYSPGTKDLGKFDVIDVEPMEVD